MMLDDVRQLLGSSEAIRLIGAASSSDEETLALADASLKAALEHLNELRADWLELLERVQRADERFLAAIEQSGTSDSFTEEDECVYALLRRDKRISYRQAVEQALKERFSGKRFAKLRDRLCLLYTSPSPRDS